MIDCTRVEINAEAQEVLISGVDLDSLWTHTDEPEEDATCPEITYKFDTSLAGTRKYLYIVTKNNKKANKHRYMDDRLSALVGETLYLSPNFRV